MKNKMFYDTILDFSYQLKQSGKKFFHGKLNKIVSFEIHKLNENLNFDKINSVKTIFKKF